MKIKTKISGSIWLFCLLLLSGCERGFDSEDSLPDAGSDELIPISVQVDGIENFYGGAVTRGGITEESFRQALDTLKDSGYDVVTTYEAVLVPPQPVSGGLTITLTIDGVNRAVTVPAAQFSNNLTAGKQYTISLIITDAEIMLPASAVTTNDWSSVSNQDTNAPF